MHLNTFGKLVFHLGLLSRGARLSWPFAARLEWMKRGSSLLQGANWTCENILLHSRQALVPSECQLYSHDLRARGTHKKIGAFVRQA